MKIAAAILLLILCACSADLHLQPAPTQSPGEAALRAHWASSHDTVQYWEIRYALVCDSDHHVVTTITNNGRDDIWHTGIEPSPVEGLDFAKHQVEIAALQEQTCPEAK